MIIDTLTTKAWKCGETQKITCQNGKSNSSRSIAISVVVIMVELLVMFRAFSVSHMSTLRTQKTACKGENHLKNLSRKSPVFEIALKMEYSLNSYVCGRKM